jgi:glycerol kinase
VGVWYEKPEISKNWALNRRFSPSMDEDMRSRLYRGWQRAVKRVLAWEEADEVNFGPDNTVQN